MITIYKNGETGLVRIPEPAKGCWINAIDPTPEEIAQIQALGIQQDYITYSLDLDERARIERENGELLILMRIPFFQGETVDLPYTTIPLGIILTDEYTITVSKKENEILQEMTNGRIKDVNTSKRLRFVLRVLLTTATHFLDYLRKINKKVDALEDQLTESTRNSEVLELLKFQKSLTVFTTALKANELMMERLQRMQLFKTYPEDEDLLEDVITENQQAIEMTNIASNILSSMMDAFASIISNNLNVVMKILASITIVLSLPILVTSFYGMNVPLPFMQHPLAYVLILGISFLLALMVVYVFWKRDWF
jgi:magnesium transporter